MLEARGVFGVNECWIGVETLSSLDGRKPLRVRSEEGVFDMSPVREG